MSPAKPGDPALPENQEHYRDLVENSLDLICTHTLDGVLLTVNLAAARSLGYESAALVNRNLHELLAPDLHSELDGYLAVLRERGTATGMVDLQTTAGEKRTWSYISTRRTEGVAAPFVHSVAHDVTEILRAQKALRESEERLRVAAEVGRMYAWEWDPVTDLVRRSAECASILGNDESSPEGVARDYFTFIHPDDGPRLLNVVDTLTPDAPDYRMQYRRTRTDGVLLWLEESGHATFDRAGKLVRLVGMTADITERKQAEAKLQTSEEFSRQIVQKSPVAMLVVNGGLEQKAVVMNDKFTVLFGYTKEDIAEVEDWWPLAYPDESYRTAIREDWQARVAEAIRSQSDIEPMEARVRCKNGAYRYIQFHFAPLGGASLVTFIDLTDQKNAELALANLGRRLIETQEEERSRIGQELHDDLCFELAILGHGMDGLIDMLAGSGAEARERAVKLRKRVAEILLGAAMLSHELHSPKIELLGLGGAVQSLCDEIAGTHHIRVDFVAVDLPTSLPKDISICLFRAAQEALRNSVKHSGADRVRVELSGKNGAIQLSVCDAGVGFDPATAITGPGIGLISMRERINLVKGTMAIHSKPSGGTEIRCSVPISGAVGAVPFQ